VKIRDATPADAAAACEVLRASITELCVADHRNDPAILAAWLANKMPAIVAGWAADPAGSLLLAVEGDAILAVGGVKDCIRPVKAALPSEARCRELSLWTVIGAVPKSNGSK
jgi:hypothetical protein